jgi:nucleoid-associated protein YgaU
MATTIDPLLFPATTVRSHSNRSVRPSVSQRTFQRRRMAVGAVLVFGLASAFISTGAFASDPESAQQTAPRTVIAKNGDTLWDIARQIVPKGAIGDLVSEMVLLNGSTIEPGQVIRIP